MEGMKETREVLEAVAKIGVLVAKMAGPGSVQPMELLGILSIWDSLVRAAKGASKIPEEWASLDDGDFTDLQIAAVRVAEDLGVEFRENGDARRMADGSLQMAHGMVQVLQAVRRA